MDSSILTIFAVTLTGVISQLFAAHRDRRNRKWSQEDRALKAATVAAELDAQTRLMAVHGEAQTGAVISRIEHGASLSAAALSEANGTNQKIQSLAEKLTELIDRLPCQRPKEESCLKP